MDEKIKNISNLKVMDELTVVPTYKVIDKKHDLDTKRITIILANISNDFDVIKIEVSKDIGNLVEYDNEYSINTRTKRTWYTLWFGKKKEHSVLGNVPKKGNILVTTTPLSKRGLEDFQNQWKDTFKGE
ncbi:hypothetical protein [Mammaliicoccus virus vB_MscM-PMS2]|nr:hypothetical protein [Mammaliicoccus virus vB_MscM-PMS2]